MPVLEPKKALDVVIYVLKHVEEYKDLKAKHKAKIVPPLQEVKTHLEKLTDLPGEVSKVPEVQGALTVIMGVSLSLWALARRPASLSSSFCSRKRAGV